MKNKIFAILITLFICFGSINNVWSADYVSVSSDSSINLDNIKEASSKKTDISKNALISMFGEVAADPFKSTKSSNSTLLSEVLKLLNFVILGVVIFIILYKFIVKMISTAHDGRVFDEKYDLFWMPIRSVIALIFCIPTAAGWCLAQLLMLWSASIIGIGTANLATKTIVEQFNKGVNLTVNQPFINSFNPDIQNLARIMACKHAINIGHSNYYGLVYNTAADNSTMYKYYAIGKKTFLDSNNKYNLKKKVEVFGSNSGVLCGEVSYMTEPPKFKSWGEIVNDAYLTPVMKGVPKNENEAIKLFISAYNDALITAEDELDNLLKRYMVDLDTFNKTGVKDPGSSQKDNDQNNGDKHFLDNRLFTKIILSKEIKNISQKYEEKIKEATASYDKNKPTDAYIQELTSSIEKKGWWMLGSWYQTFASANQTKNKILDFKPKVIAKDFLQEMPLSLSDENFFKTAILSVEKTMLSVGEDNYSGITSSHEDADSIISKVYYPFTAMKVMNNVIKGDGKNYDALLMLKDQGDYILGVTNTSLVAYISVKAASAGFKSSVIGKVSDWTTGIPSGIAAALDTISVFINIIFGLSYGSGMALSIYIPMIPFIIWFAACINWLIIVAEGVVAAPLWAMSHAGSGGEGLGQRSSYGYMFLLNMFFRPFLMVAGFLLAGTIVNIGGTVVSNLFMVAVANLQANSMTGLLSVIGFLILYVIICINMVTAAFNLIFIIPDQALQFAGGVISNITLGREAGSESQNKFNESLSNLSGQGNKIHGSTSPLVEYNKNRIKSQNSGKNENGNNIEGS